MTRRDRAAALLLLVGVLAAGPAAAATEPGEGFGLNGPDDAACPPDVPLLEPVAGVWRAAGTTAGQPSHGTGTCGGGAGDALHRFVAPRAGDYLIQLRSAHPEADPVLHVREACGAGARELACQDDGLEGVMPSLALALAEGQSVVLFADGFLDFDTGAWRGAYELTVSPIGGPDEGPSLHTCRCPDVDDGRVCSAEGCGGDDDPCVTITCSDGAPATSVACVAAGDRCLAPGVDVEGTAVLTCRCQYGLGADLCVTGDLCAGNDPVDACATVCRGFGFGVVEAWCEPDHKRCGGDAWCPEDLGAANVFYRVVACGDGPAPVDCAPELFGPDNAAFHLPGCGCGCVDVSEGCPDDDREGVFYASRDARECVRMDPIQCPPGSRPFYSPYCGCGCDPGEGPQCPIPGRTFSGDGPDRWRYIEPPGGCAAANPADVCPEGAGLWFWFHGCGCGCHDADLAEPTAEEDAADPAFFVDNVFVCLLEGPACPEGAEVVMTPISCGCRFDPAQCPTPETSASWVSDDYAECNRLGVQCEPGTVPFIHPSCGCGCRAAD